MIILGIDPGSRITGFGLIDNQASRIDYIDSGHIKVSGASLPQRLGFIFSAIDEVIRKHQAQQMSIENVFMARNADSALKLGQSIVGSGAATKEQVQHMVQRLLGIRQALQADEADGLAIAICHAQFYATRQKTGIDPGLLKRRRSRRR